MVAHIGTAWNGFPRRFVPVSPAFAHHENRKQHQDTRRSMRHRRLENKERRGDGGGAATPETESPPIPFSPSRRSLRGDSPFLSCFSCAASCSSPPYLCV